MFTRMIRRIVHFSLRHSGHCEDDSGGYGHCSDTGDGATGHCIG